MRVLHAADLHLDSAFGALTAEQARQRRAESRRSPERLVEWANDHGVQLLLLAGDLFDGGELRGDTAPLLARALGAFRGRVVIAPGNHDPYTADGPYARTLWPDNVHIFTEDRMQAVTFPELGCTVYGAAFTAPELPEDHVLAGFTAPEDGLVHIGLLHLGQDRDGRGRRVHAAAGLRLRHALDAVDAGFKLESRIRPIAADDKVSFLNAAQLRIVVVEQLHAVPPLFRVHRIHAVEVGGKKRALLPAYAAADLDDDVFVVVRVARQEQHAQLVKKALFFRLGSVQFLLRHVLELGIGYKLQRLHDVVLALLVRAVGLHHGGKLLLLARERAQLLWVSVNFRHFEQLADLVIAARELFELFPHQALSSAMKSEQALTNWSRQKW